MYNNKKKCIPYYDIMLLCIKEIYFIKLDWLVSLAKNVFFTNNLN